MHLAKILYLETKTKNMEKPCNDKVVIPKQLFKLKEENLTSENWKLGKLVFMHHSIDFRIKYIYIYYFRVEVESIEYIL